MNLVVSHKPLKQAALLSDGSYHEAQLLLQIFRWRDSLSSKFQNLALIALKFDAVKAVGMD